MTYWPVEVEHDVESDFTQVRDLLAQAYIKIDRLYDEIGDDQLAAALTSIRVTGGHLVTAKRNLIARSA